MKSPDEKVIPTPFRRLFEPADSEEAELQDEYPYGVIVRASTDLHCADEDVGDWIICPLQSPGQTVQSGGDLNAAFEAERAILSRVLGHLGVLNLAVVPSAAGLSCSSRFSRLSVDESGKLIDLGTVLTFLRISLGWSVDDLARESRVRSTTISGYERGTMIPGINSISMIMEALGYPFAALDVARTCIGLLLSTRKHSLWTQRDHYSADRKEGPA